MIDITTSLWISVAFIVQKRGVRLHCANMDDLIRLITGFFHQFALGGLLNELGDVISDISLYIPFGLVAGISTVAVNAVVVLAVLSEMTGVVAVQIGASRRYDGPMGKSDRALVFGSLALLLGLGLEPGAWANAALLLVAMLTAATIVNRARAALGELERSV